MQTQSVFQAFAPQITAEFPELSYTLKRFYDTSKYFLFIEFLIYPPVFALNNWMICLFGKKSSKSRALKSKLYSRWSILLKTYFNHRTVFGIQRSHLVYQIKETIITK